MQSIQCVYYSAKMRKHWSYAFSGNMNLKIFNVPHDIELAENVISGSSLLDDLSNIPAQRKKD